MKILGTAKLLAIITLLLNRPARMVEWAYAGLTIMFLGASASHLLAGDAPLMVKRHTGGNPKL